jgi:hypothetical protein
MFLMVGCSAESGFKKAMKDRGATNNEIQQAYSFAEMMYDFDSISYDEGYQIGEIAAIAIGH